MMTSGTLGSGAAWNAAELVDWQMLDAEEFGGVVYAPVFLLEVRAPENTKGFFRVSSTATQSEVGVLFPVQNGIQVGSQPGISMDVQFGGQRVVFVGGVRVQPKGGVE